MVVSDLQKARSRRFPKPFYHNLIPPQYAYAYAICLARVLVSRRVLQSRLSLSETSIKIIKNEVGCRDDTVPKTVDTKRHCEVGVGQSSTTPKTKCREGRLLHTHSYFAVHSVSLDFGTVSSIHPFL